MSTKEIRLNVDIPDGFEATGEYRPPRKGEYYLNECGARFVEPRGYLFPAIILRKIGETPIVEGPALAVVASKPKWRIYP